MTKQQKRARYRVVDHTADVALYVWGDTLEDLFVNAATGMFAQMAGAQRARAGVRRRITVEGDDYESLLVAWLSELLYLREINREAYGRFEVCFPAPARLDGSAEGYAVPAFDRPIKAVTYHGLKVERKGRTYHATIVFDV